MKIQFKKSKDKPSVLTCIRKDGSITWVKIHPNFEVHDLAHYAVETILGFKKAFYGLIAEGFNIEDFELPRDQRPDALIPENLPREALQTEHMVNLLMTGLQKNTQDYEFTEQLNEILTQAGIPYPKLLTSDSLIKIKESLESLLSKWEAVEEGAMLELDFDE